MKTSLQQRQAARGSRAAFSGKQARRPVACRASSERQAAAAIAAGACLTALQAPAAHAAASIAQLAELDGSVTLAVGGGAAVMGLGALLVATDPQKRCGAGRAAVPAPPRAARGALHGGMPLARVADPPQIRAPEAGGAR
jgi:hypothetical protein